MRKETLFKKVMDTASKIYFNERKLKEIAYVFEGEWTIRNTTDKEEFKTEVKLNKNLYKKLREYRDKVFNLRVIDKTITHEEYTLIEDKTDALLNGTYKEKYS